ncbi:MAG: hypothetical protein ACI4SO_06075 [Muribaculaceae bacterium]
MAEKASAQNLIFAVQKALMDKTQDKAVDINGSKVFVENGEVKTILSEEIQRSGYMSVEDSLNKRKVKMIYALKDSNNKSPA